MSTMSMQRVAALAFLDELHKVAQAKNDPSFSKIAGMTSIDELEAFFKQAGFMDTLRGAGSSIAQGARSLGQKAQGVLQGHGKPVPGLEGSSIPMLSLGQHLNEMNPLAGIGGQIAGAARGAGSAISGAASGLAGKLRSAVAGPSTGEYERQMRELSGGVTNGMGGGAGSHMLDSDNRGMMGDLAGSLRAARGSNPLHAAQAANGEFGPQHLPMGGGAGSHMLDSDNRSIGQDLAGSLRAARAPNPLHAAQAANGEYGPQHVPMGGGAGSHMLESDNRGVGQDLAGSLRAAQQPDPTNAARAAANEASTSRGAVTQAMPAMRAPAPSAGEMARRNPAFASGDSQAIGAAGPSNPRGMLRPAAGNYPGVPEEAAAGAAPAAARNTWMGVAPPGIGAPQPPLRERLNFAAARQA